jgi:hypothetical protein
VNVGCDHLLRVQIGVKADMFSRRRVPDRHIRAFDASSKQQSVQFLGNLPRCPRLRTRVAPAVAGTVVGADASCGSQFRLDEVPIE